MRTVLALGGNAIASEDPVTVAGQRRHVRETAAEVARLDDRGHDLVLTHGNGPQVGQLLRQQAAADVPDRPLDVLVAETQAQVGYLLANQLDDRVDRRVTALVTRARVDPTDPQFDDPSKPVGPYYTEAEVAEADFETAPVTTPAGERAYRRVVPSPRPVEVLEADHIRELVDSGAMVVCGGGGGVPVVDTERDVGTFEGVEAVVDKDYTSSLVGEALAADCLVMATDVPFAYRDFGTEEQAPIREASAARMRDALAAGEFGEGNMRPKVEACLAFLDAGGSRAVITTPADIAAAVAGETGTQIRP